jgi:hypothetical protein
VVAGIRQGYQKKVGFCEYLETLFADSTNANLNALNAKKLKILIKDRPKSRSSTPTPYSAANNEAHKGLLLAVELCTDGHLLPFAWSARSCRVSGGNA